MARTFLPRNLMRDYWTKIRNRFIGTKFIAVFFRQFFGRAVGFFGKRV